MELMVNIWAALACAVASMILGFLWYGPLFSKAWMKEMGIDPNDQATMARMKQGAKTAYIQQFIGAILMAFVFGTTLLAFEKALGAYTIAMSLEGAFWTWIGFVVPVKYGEVLWGKATKKLFLIDSFYYLVLLAVYAVILTLWK